VPALVAATAVTTAPERAAAPAPLSPSPAPLVAATSLTGEPASYVTPPASTRGVGVIPPAQLASYVVAHSEYGSPLGRRNVLTGLVADELQPASAPAPASAPRAAGDTPVSAPR
jgi:hypothetical protein